MLKRIWDVLVIEQTVQKVYLALHELLDDFFGKFERRFFSRARIGHGEPNIHAKNHRRLHKRTQQILSLLLFIYLLNRQQVHANIFFLIVNELCTLSYPHTRCDVTTEGYKAVMFRHVCILKMPLKLANT